MPSITYPLLKDFMREQSGTLYVLSDYDSHDRLRDSLATVLLAQFFATHQVRFELRPVLARHRRLYDATDVLAALPAESMERGQIVKLLKEALPFEDCIRQLFNIVEDARKVKVQGMAPMHGLQPRGPILMLGGPRSYPEELLDHLRSELKVRSDQNGLDGRFQMPVDDPNAPEFRKIVDTYFGREIKPVFFPEGKPAGSLVDYAIIRKVAGPFRRRTFLFAYGTGAFGTLAAAQFLIDPDQNELLARWNVEAFFETHGCVEILLRAERRGHYAIPQFPWTNNYEPSQLTTQIVAKPVTPVSPAARSWIHRLRDAMPGKRIDDLYSCIESDPGNGIRKFTVIGLHPSKYTENDDRSPCAWHMVGGRAIQKVVQSLRAAAAEARPILLVGPTGVGKELAARVIYQERALRLLRRLGRGEEPKLSPAIVGARYTATNCAALPEGLAEAELFGIGRRVASDVDPSHGAILDAGEGVALLDEIESMGKDKQAKLLRAVQPPYAIKPVGVSRLVPCAALIVAATNEDPDVLVSKDEMRPDLLARFRAGIVRIPPLTERPGDVPALLAYIAGTPVSCDERVLRCLLADRHPLNVRGLHEILGRAQQRQQHERTDGHGHTLRIVLTDLGEASQDAFADLPEEMQSQSPPPVFQFEVPPFSDDLGIVFDEAVFILTSLKINKEGKVIVRSPSNDYGEIWGTKQRGQSNLLLLQQEAKERGTEWFHLIEHVVKTIPEGDTREDALDMLGQMFQGRTQAGKKEITHHFVRCYEPGRGVLQKDFAKSLGLSPSRFTELLK